VIVPRQLDRALPSSDDGVWGNHPRIAATVNRVVELWCRDLNRTENLRAIPPSDADKRLFPRRNDTESINRALDDTIYLRRAHSVGQTAQLTDLLGFALLVNARTRARHRAREPLQVAA